MQPDTAAVQSALMALITDRGDSASADAEALIVGDARASAEERLGVYRFMYRARVVEALESQFPHLARHLGTSSFAELAAAYIADEPSTHYSLRFIGERLPGWLEARRPDDPLLGGLARLEWARTDVFDLADEPVATIDAVRAWPPEHFGELPLRLVSAHRIVTVPAGTCALWDATGSAPVASDRAPGAVETAVVWRQETMVYHRTIEPLERAALQLAARGTRFGLICDALLVHHGEQAAVERAYSILATWLADGLVRATTGAGPS